jgi:RHS repeat-associated protein
VANSKGRLTNVGSSVSSYSYGEYDALGRIKTCAQTTDGTSYSMSYSYNLAAMTSQTYPSGRVVASVYDNAGRLAGVKNQATGMYYAGAAAADTANRIQYTAHGAVGQMRLGNSLWEHTNFNSRLQPVQIGLGTAGNNSSVLQLDYSYGTSNNNGNVQSQTISLPGGPTLTQTYGYDQLNRLLSAQEMNGGNQSWQQVFTYFDQNGQNGRYGNRRIDATNTTPGLVTENPRFDPTTNRIQPQAGEQYAYDPAGNLTRNQTGHTFAYDAENRQTGYDGGNPVTGGASYAYDGDGRRVKKLSGSGTTIFVYNAMGQLVAEYTDAQPTSSGTSYLTADSLGTPRVITNSNGSVIGRHDYLPFGEEIAASYGGRSAVTGYPATDGVRQQFTQKERDIETGLDYFGARYYGSTQGRFTGCDPKLLGIKQVINPQRWNRYAYVLNNPLALYDPDGQDDQGKGGGRVIDIFLWSESSLKGDDRMTRTQRAELNQLREAGKANGVQINVYEGAANTAERASESLATPGRVVIMGVHSVQDMDGNKIGMQTTTGIIARSDVLTNQGGDPNNPLEAASRPADRAELVVAMACDTANLSGVFQGAGNFIGVNGGADHASSTYGLNQAIIATVGVIVNANGDLGPGTLNSIVTNSQSVIRNNRAQQNPDPDDSVILNPALMPPMRYERYPRRPED